MKKISIKTILFSICFLNVLNFKQSLNHNKAHCEVASLLFFKNLEFKQQDKVYSKHVTMIHITRTLVGFKITFLSDHVVG